MKILVFMSDNRSVLSESYVSYVAAINFEYCKKYGYDFTYYRPYLKDKQTTTLYNCIDPNSMNLRHAAWSKLLSTQLALTRPYDYIVYIDSDCIFWDFRISLEQFLAPYLDRDFVFTNDQPHNPMKPNTGFFACKVNERTKHNIRDWYNCNIPEYNTCHAYEQNGLWKILHTFSMHLVDMWVFYETGQFLRHISSFVNDERLPYFSTFIKKANIEYLKNITTIHQSHMIEFDTTTMYPQSVKRSNNLSGGNINDLYIPTNVNGGNI
jgi:hypothetical protein